MPRFYRKEEVSDVDVKRVVLPNGMRLISERVAGSASVGVGLWADVGSRQETLSKNGIAHFIEHEVFKGTEGRSMREIMRSIESRGGMLNAFTTKEHTCYYAWTRTIYLDEAVNILHELALRPKFTERDIARERSVIIEEIRGLEDEADEMLFDLFEQELFGSHPLAKTVIGTEKTVKSFHRDDLLAFHKKHYSPERLAIVASGAHSHDVFFEIAERLFSKEPPSKRKVKNTPEKLSRKVVHKTVTREGAAQAHLVIGRRSPNIYAEKLAASSALVTLLGVGMSSRLNLRLREEMGLAYEAMAFHSPYSDVGCIGLYAAVTDENIEKATNEMFKILRGLFTKEISSAELERTKEQMIGSAVLSMEAITTRLMRTGQNEMYYERYIPIEEEIRKIAALTLNDVRAIAEELFRDETALSVVSIVPKN